MQLKSNLMLLAPNLIQLILKLFLALLHQPHTSKVRNQRVRRGFGVEISQEAADVAATETQIGDLRFEHFDVVCCGEFGGWAGERFLCGCAEG
jgi:hypothetical protein